MSTLQRFIDEILFVIVVYEREPGTCPAFKSLCASAEANRLKYTLSLYDNSALPHHANIFSQHGTVYYHHNIANVALSTSYNRAHAEAVDLHKKWIFLLDQDTHLPVNFFNAYFESVQLFPAQILFAPVVSDEVGILSPVKFTWGKGKRMAGILHGLHAFQAVRPINTGMMIRLDVFRRVKGYEESIALDFSDFAFIEKVKSNYPNFVVVDLIIRQEFFDLYASKEAAIHRFRFYYQGALEMSRLFGPAWAYYYRIVLRTIYLSVRFRSFAFLTSFLKQAQP